MKLIYLCGILALGLIAGCGGNSDEDRAALNRAPSVSAIGDQSTAANRSSEPFPFSVDDEDVGSLQIEVSSDRQQIVADENLELSGSDAARRLRVTPIADTTGEVMITTVVTDREGLSASSAFVLTVVPEQRSIQQFARSTFAEADNDEPTLINAVEFLQDADGDDFTDLFLD